MAWAVARQAASSAGWQLPQRALPVQSRPAAHTAPGAPASAAHTRPSLHVRESTAATYPARPSLWYRIDVASPAIVIGLTGGIASGKSAVAARLRQRGAAVIDADELARLVVAPGQPALAEIAARFGAEMIDGDGSLDRKRLGAVVFADPAARKDLERITHPRIAAAGQAEIARHAAAGARVVFYEAPLIVENGLYRAMAALIVVAVPPEVQLARLMGRDGSSEEAARARIAAQLPLAKKLEVATWVIENSGDVAALDGEVDRVAAAIKARFGVAIQASG